VRHAIEDAGIEVTSSDLTMLPTSLVELDSAEIVKPILRLIDALDEHDDVQDVYANFDIPESVLASLDA
jgi:transcriptional/translational regulatory protein YebC/TACO1